MKIIKGTQSTIYINEVTNIVKKVGTERGKQDTIDQIAFYLNIPEHVRGAFPQIISYVNGPEEYSYTYNYIDFPNLRHLLLEGQFNEKWSDKLVLAMTYITNSIHTIEQSEPSRASIYETYITRCERRVAEAQSFLEQDINLLDADVCISGEIIRKPISRIIQFLNDSFELLVPPYMCTTHGQLGPSHIFLSEMDDRFTLIDPKGFAKLYDPVIDFCKIGKAMLFATEWLEEDRYNIKYSIQNNTVYVEKYVIDNFDYNQLREYYEGILDRIPLFSEHKVRVRNMAMICADLIGGLPFAYIAGGVEYVIALLAQISTATKMLSTEF